MYVFAPEQTVVKYPYSIGELKRDQPGTSFPTNPSLQLLAEWSVFPVTPHDPPSFDNTTHEIKQVDPELIDGEWKQSWLLLELTPDEALSREEEQARIVRAQRNRLLSESDWTQLPDSPADHEAWAVYRQALRDMTAQAGFPWYINWPEEP